MLGRLRGAELGHLAEHGERAGLRVSRPPRPGDRDQGVQRRAHRLGIRVVGVVDDDDAVGPLGELHPPPRRRDGRLDGGGRLLHRHADGQGDRGRREGVADVVGADQAQPHRHVRPAGVQRERGPAEVVEAHVGGPDVGPLGRAERHDAGRGARGHRGHERVVGVEHGDAVGRQRLDQFALGLRDRLARAELAEVRGADVEHDADAAAARSR